MNNETTNNLNGERNMTKANIIKAVKAVSAERGITELEVITEMQSGCAITGDDSTMSILCEMKWDFI